MTLAPSPQGTSVGVAGFGRGALWMVVVWAVPVIAIVAVVAAFAKSKA